MEREITHYCPRCLATCALDSEGYVTGHTLCGTGGLLPVVTVDGNLQVSDDDGPQQ